MENEMAITGTMIRRAIAINAHPAGKAGMQTAHYPTPNRVGIHPDQTVIREWFTTASGQTITVAVIHAHGNGRINCVNCL